MGFVRIIGIVSFLVIAFSSLGFATFCELNFKDCGSKGGKLISVQINETCTAAKSAVLKKGTSAKINFTFTADKEETKLTSVVHGELSSVPIFIPFPLDQPDACKDSGLTCPIKANTQLSYYSLLKVLSSYPSVNVIVKWELQDASGSDIFCAEIKAQLV